MIEVIGVCQLAHGALSLEGMHSLLLPRKGHYGLVDYEKIYCPDRKNGPDIFDLREIDRRRGCIVVVRPDQYIAQVLPLHAHAELAAYFQAFML